ncbi:bactofilin family protein [Shewanella sp. OMA3-2]|uniref:bactofilin family protein n=1 Tax=Shewanella sp. OMA3-2 TaxID=2908650 RepID=UPI001F1E427A|nr:polymer-forming cytoskeletal protein [Shewanella sp. OMA3-2]UJF21713.1 polymer-forming cytoskeletal protein [Shewanella sp. OMA3-2]
MNNKSKGVTYIGADMSLNGEIDIQGPALIAGKITGVIRSSDEVKIEPGGIIDGEVYCQELRVSGTLKGKLFCNKLVIISTGVVEADVSSHDMEIYDGGQFIGQRTKGPDADALPASTDSIARQMSQQTSSSDNVQARKVAKQSPQTTSSSSLNEDQKTNMPSNKVLLSIMAIAVAALLGWQSGALSSFSSPPKASSEPALFTPISESVESITERNAAKLLNDVKTETFLVEQREELINAGLADPNMAMEDLQAMEASNELMSDNIETSSEESVKELVGVEDKIAAKVNAITDAVNKTQTDK